MRFKAIKALGVRFLRKAEWSIEAEVEF